MVSDRPLAPLASSPPYALPIPAPAPESESGRSGSGVFEKPKASWREAVRAHEAPSYRRAALQTATTFVPFLLLLAAMAVVAPKNLLLAYLLAIPAAGFALRLFILQHDCSHGSFVPSSTLNHVLGSIFGVFTITPYFKWRHNHLTHHAWSGNLDRRVRGAEFYTMTVDEYLAASPKERFRYRLYRSPWILLPFGGIFAFALSNRWFSSVSGKSRPRDRISVWATNAAMVLLAYGMGFRTYLLIYVPIVLLAGTAGLILFYVQHQFEDGYFVHKDEWDHFEAAMTGSSHLVLPEPLRFFSANIGYHHVHHLSPRVPNYAIERCHRALAWAGTPTKLHLRDLPRLFRLALWDAERQRLVSFADVASRSGQ